MYNNYYYLILSILSSFITLNIMKKFKLDNSLDSQNNKNKKIKNNTPILGGLIFIVPIMIYILLQKNLKLFGWLTLSVCFGLYDDINKILGKATSKGLNRVSKFIFLLINLLTYNKLFNKTHSLKDFIFYSLTYTGVLVTDGIDGLLATLTCSTLFFIKYMQIDNNLLNVSLISLIPFIIINLNPAKIFMGDTGSSFLAALLYYFINKENDSIYLASIYHLGSISSGLQIITNKIINKKILNFSPFHHNLETLGWNEYQIVIFYNLFYYLILIYSFINI